MSEWRTLGKLRIHHSRSHNYGDGHRSERRTIFRHTTRAPIDKPRVTGWGGGRTILGGTSREAVHRKGRQARQGR